jgi:hypothetical protein
LHLAQYRIREDWFACLVLVNAGEETQLLGIAYGQTAQDDGMKQVKDGRIRTYA